MKPAEGDAYDKPLDIQTHNGDVVIVGPGATSMALTAEAAAASANRLAEAAKAALTNEEKIIAPAPGNGSADGA